MTKLKIFLLAMLMILVADPSAMSRSLPASKPPVKVAVENPLPAHEHSDKCKQTSAEPVQIICILDRSGSMSALASDTIGGYNSFLEKQRQEPGTAEVTTVLFDDRYELINDAVDLQKTEDLTSAQYYARGTTALLDAVGRTLTEVAGKMEKQGICPAERRVLVLIMTDGLENASHEYQKATVKSMIEKATNDYKWNFIFMGANIDSISEASSIGIAPTHAANYSHDREGVAKSFMQMEAAAAEMRSSGSVSEDWKK